MRSRERLFWVYIVGSLSGTLYVGFTSELEVRSIKHKEGFYKGFTEKYGVDRLLYYETYDDPHAAIAREKQLKGWVRKKKIALIDHMNPHWEDLARAWYEDLLQRRAKWEESLKAAASRW